MHALVQPTISGSVQLQREEEEVKYPSETLPFVLMMRAFSALTITQGERCLWLDSLKVCDFPAAFVKARVPRVEENRAAFACIL